MGAKKCLDATHLEECPAGTSITTTCAGQCVDSGAGAACTSAITTKTITLHVKYETRFPKPDYTGFADAASLAAGPPNLLVVSYAGEDIVDSTQLDSTGAASIKVPVNPSGDDQIVLFAAAPDTNGGWAYVVANPGFATGGSHELTPLGNPSFWSWSLGSAGLSDDQSIVVREANGSGALRVFDFVRYVYSLTASFQNGAPGHSLITWVSPDTAWNCGSCMWSKPITFADFTFREQMFINGPDRDYYSDAVIAHELGHWAMNSYGTSPREGGTHYQGKAYPPGMAWSEGWATWHSSTMRGSTRYFSEQDGSMSWFDIGLRQYQHEYRWVLPSAGAGLMQLIDENQIASMLYLLSTSPSVGRQTVFKALASARMNTSPFPRGYTTHTWDIDAHGEAVNIVDTGRSAPFIADFLDALACAGVSRSVIDAVTVPATQYPYPSASPICQ